jgi:tetratricopeptide (TPR) repeat protein
MRSLLIFLLLQAPLVFAQSRSAEAEQVFAAATKQHEQGDLEGAIKGYQLVLRQFPNSVDVMSNLGAAFAGLGRYEGAIAQFKRALAIAGDNQQSVSPAASQGCIVCRGGAGTRCALPQQSDRVVLTAIAS